MPDILVDSTHCSWLLDDIGIPIGIQTPQGVKQYFTKSPAKNTVLDPTNVAFSGGTIGGTTSITSSARSIAGAGNFFGLLGDSVTVGTGSTNAGTTAYAAVLPSIAGGLVVSTTSTNAGVAGETTANMLARLPALLATGIQSLTILAGQNDANNAVPLATFTANITSMIALARNAGVQVFLGSALPRAVAVAASIRQQIEAQRLTCIKLAQKFAIKYVATNEVLSDPLTGGLLAAYDSGDGLHPNDTGHFLIAKAFSDVIKAASLSIPQPVSSVSALNYVNNPLMQGAGPLPTGYTQNGFSSGTAAVYTVIAPTNNLKYGNWLQVDINAVVDSVVVVAAPTTGTNVTGDMLALSCIAEVTGVTATWSVLQAAGASITAYYTQNGAILGGLGFGKADSIGPLYQKYLSTNTGPGILLWITVKAGQRLTARFGQLGIINETASGVVQ